MLPVSTTQTLPTPEEVASLKEHIEQNWINEDKIEDDQKTLRKNATIYIVDAYARGLSDLFLTRKGLKSLPKEIRFLTNLKKLCLIGNQLTSLPEEIRFLTNLEMLSVVGNQLTSLPAGIASLTKLQMLFVSNNQLTSLPAGIGALTDLLYLDVSDNKLTLLSAEIGALTELRVIVVKNNRLTSLPDSIFNSSKHISSEENRIEAAEISRLQSLVSKARGSGLKIDFLFSNYDPFIAAGGVSSHGFPFPDQSITSMVHAIASIAPEQEEQEKILDLFRSSEDKIGMFKQLIGQCTRTKSFEKANKSGAKLAEHPITKILYNISTACIDNEEMLQRVNLLSAGSGETCGDRVAITLLDVQFEALVFPIPAKELTNPLDLFEYARRKSAIKFLQEKAEDKFERDGDDEIEVNLAYMQLLPEFEINVGAIEMIYRSDSGISKKDLKKTKEEFFAADHNYPKIKFNKALTYKYLLDNEEFTDHPIAKIINEIKSKIAERPEFDMEKVEGKPGSMPYLENCRKLQKKIISKQIKAMEILQTFFEQNHKEQEEEERKGAFVEELDEKIAADNSFLPGRIFDIKNDDDVSFIVNNVTRSLFPEIKLRREHSQDDAGFSQNIIFAGTLKLNPKYINQFDRLISEKWPNDIEKSNNDYEDFLNLVKMDLALVELNKKLEKAEDHNFDSIKSLFETIKERYMNLNDINKLQSSARVQGLTFNIINLESKNEEEVIDDYIDDDAIALLLEGTDLKLEEIIDEDYDVNDDVIASLLEGTDPELEEVISKHHGPAEAIDGDITGRSPNKTSSRNSALPLKKQRTR